MRFLVFFTSFCMFACNYNHTMKTSIGKLTTVLLSLGLAVTASAQIGQPFMHDPSSIAECDGKYYTLGTGNGGLMSEDGWTWNGGTDLVQKTGGGVAPDILKIGDRYYVTYARGAGGNHASSCYVMWTKSLDPKSPDFGYKDETFVAGSTGFDDCDAIDPSFLLGPDGRLWLTYGTYFGFIRICELDPKTGERLKDKKTGKPIPEKNIAIDCEATAMVYKDGWYYLLGTHGTCCDGTNSTYNIVVGRSKSPTGPFIDNVGRDMLEGGGRMVLAAGDRKTGAGHFGRFVVADGVEKMSFHWEADMDLGGRSTLGIRPLLWKNGWPYAGELFKEGTYEIESERRGYALELTVDFVRLGAGGMRGGMGGGMGMGGFGGGAARPAGAGAAAGAARPAGAPAGAAAGAAAGAQTGAQAGAQGFTIPPRDISTVNVAPGAQFGPMTIPAGAQAAATAAPAQRPAATAAPAAPQLVAEQLLADVIGDWPKGNIDVRIGDYMFRPHQKWTITEVKGQPGYLGGLYYKIVIEGTNRALAATADCEVITVPQFTGAPEQLWRIDQLTDGTYRIMPKSIPGTDKKLALLSAGDSTPTLGEFDMNSDNSKWNFKAH
jgi:hypothetical protein